MTRFSLSAAVAIAATLVAMPALAAVCSRTPPFESWMSDFRREAQAKGISRQTLAAALDGLTPDPGVIRRDRGQRAFRQSFAEFSRRMVTPGRIRGGKAMMQRHAALLARIEKQYGVPAPVVVAIWGLESDFGANRGNLQTIRSIMTLAHDCRRADLFRGELLAALQIVQRGDLRPADMRGGWAGEIGQTQFMASSYLRFAVDFDGNGRRDLIHSIPDVLGSTANYLRGYGWRRGEPWGEGTANFKVLQQWNKASVYSRTLAYYATRLAEAR